MSETLSKVKVAGSDPEIRALLKSWIAAVERYCNQADDNPWWYNERATLSTLAGAAWTMGWSALEEYVSVKRLKIAIEGVDHGTLRKGRVDLVLVSPKSTQIAIEAKQALQPVKGYQYVIAAMDAAWKDSNYLLSHHYHRRFAVTFVVPSISSKLLEDENTELQGLLEDWLGKVYEIAMKRGRPIHMAYVFPALRDLPYEHDNRHFPGVVILMEERLRSTTHYE